MYLNKVNLKIKRHHFIALYDFLFEINKEVTEQLNSRHAYLDPSKYVIYDLCWTLNTTQVWHRWQNRQQDKLYTLSLPIGQAVTLCQHCFSVSYTENPDLHSFIGILYARLSEYVSGHQFTSPVPSKPQLIQS